MAFAALLELLAAVTALTLAEEETVGDAEEDVEDDEAAAAAAAVLNPELNVPPPPVNVDVPASSVAKTLLLKLAHSSESTLVYCANAELTSP